jgi:ubiquinone/menaquinone biosynthesis C-methylase UbiE
MEFEDHFSRLALEYSLHRPQYPDALFEYLASVVPATNLAWDCGTGNGQAALQLAKFFRKVYATDASPDQIAQAVAHPKVEYRVQSAEKVTLESDVIDLVTVAIAVHWFNLDQFYQEVKRVLKPGGVLAVWTYHLPQIELAIDRIIDTYYRSVLGEYWPERIRYLEEKYETLPFPFQEFMPPNFEMRAQWDLNRLVGFLSSWSAVKRYIDRNGVHPMEEIWEQLNIAWGKEDLIREVRWKLYIRLGRKGDFEM